MDALELADIAAVVCYQGPSLVTESLPVEDGVLGEYWSASRCRLDHWGRGIRRLTTHTDGRPSEKRRHRAALRFTALVEEILVSEILTRTMAVMFVAHDARHGCEEAAPIGRNIAQGHADARQRVLEAARERGESEGAAAEMLSRVCCQWNDLLLSHLAGLLGSEEFAFDAERMYDLAEDNGHGAAADHNVAGEHEAGHEHEAAGVLLRASLRRALSGQAVGKPFSADLNVQVAAAAVDSLGAYLLDEESLYKPAWVRRMERLADDSLLLVEQLLEPAPDAAARRFRV